MRLTATSLELALQDLAERDPDIARAYARVGIPPMPARRTGFALLIETICSQQVSATASRAIMGRLDEAVGKLEPNTFLALDEAALKGIGFSRQKISYGRVLAEAVASGALKFSRLNRLDDEDVIAELTRLKGIGRWTAEIYLLFALKRPDVWPADDLAVVMAVQHLKGLKKRPDRKTMLKIGEAWRPWRSVAARLMWHYYRNSPDARSTSMAATSSTRRNRAANATTKP